ncbi:MAG: GTPase HflX [SAR202 cluster bacterium]|nr:GTPase HflX [SAR202 cluster bacterium]
MATLHRPAAEEKALARYRVKASSESTSPTRPEQERVLVAGISIKGDRNARWSLTDSMSELVQLVHSAGGEVVEEITQSIDRPTSVYMGHGKIAELKEAGEKVDYTVAVFNDELTPAQQRNLERELEVKVLDRSALILDIFADRARTKEGVLQVELAQTQYLLPRLSGQWSHLERLGGGIGTRGPGESQLETDRRLARGRISKLKRELEDVIAHRSRHRSRRETSRVPVVSLVGYTNAGKSTLFNALVKAGVQAESKPFTTLDPITRQMYLPDGSRALLTDTVGFIHKLPHALVAAFRATLEELSEADLLLHVVDISHRNAAEHILVVEDTLKELKIQDKPRLLVLNKMDLAMNSDDSDEATAPDLSALGESAEGGVMISASEGWGLELLMTTILERLDQITGKEVADQSDVHFID